MKMDGEEGDGEEGESREGTAGRQDVFFLLVLKFFILDKLKVANTVYIRNEVCKYTSVHVSVVLQ